VLLKQENVDVVRPDEDTIQNAIDATLLHLQLVGAGAAETAPDGDG
jgi:hypothetical protein